MMKDVLCHVVECMVLLCTSELWYFDRCTSAYVVGSPLCITDLQYRNYILFHFQNYCFDVGFFKLMLVSKLFLFFDFWLLSGFSHSCSSFD